MIEKNKQKLTLDQPVTYQIKVPELLDDGWSDWEGEITVLGKRDDDGLPITTLTGNFDQAALQGLLRHLYSLGLPLISVQVIRK
ncbi:MAG: hypothetical protein P8Y72_16280 [Anaerolineales bacterium]